jgi:hypothetical protein
MDTVLLDQHTRSAIMEAFGIDLLPEAEQEALLERVSGVIFEGVMLRVMRSLDDTKKETLTTLFTEASTGGSEEKQLALQAFFEHEVLDFDTFVTAEIEALVHAPQDVFLADTRR